MTITLYLQKETLLRDLQTLQVIFQAGSPEFVEPLSKFFQPLAISTVKQYSQYDVAIQVIPEEFALIGVFNGGI
jgi:hypothetical protein